MQMPTPVLSGIDALSRDGNCYSSGSLRGSLALRLDPLSHCARPRQAKLIHDVGKFFAANSKRRSQFRNKAFLEFLPASCRVSESLKQQIGGDKGIQGSAIRDSSGGYELEAETRLLSTSEYSADKRMFIFGFGYTSCVLARFLKKNNWKVSGTCRSDERRTILEQYGFTSYLFNSGNDGEELRDDGIKDLLQATYWLTSVPPVAEFDKDPVLATHINDLVQAAKSGSVRWVGYLSSTGVYGDWQGDWVNETSEPRPVDQKAVARLAAERSWLQFGLDHHVPVHVFRLGGIYGPGRSALDTILRKGALSKRQQIRERRRFTSRIHVADVCQVLLASIENPCPGGIYNVVDDDPAPRSEVLVYALDLLQSKKESEYHCVEDGITYTSRGLDESNSLSKVEEKRVTNAKIKQELDVELLYPTYRCGLEAILEDYPKVMSSALEQMCKTEANWL